MRRALFAIVSLTLLISAPASAHALPLGLAFYAPEILSPPAQRYEYVGAFAKHLSTVVGTPISGKAYRSARDLERDMRAGKVHFAILGPFYLASRARFTHLAQARMRSNRALTWSLMGKTISRFSQLKGKRLQIANFGKIGRRFLENALLDGLSLKALRSKVKVAPDMNSVLAALRVGRADCAFAPVSAPGLKPLLEGIRIAPPAFVATSKKVSPVLLGKVKAAVLKYGVALSSMVGWQPAKPNAYRTIAALSKRIRRTMIAARAPAVVLRPDALLEAKQVKISAPPLEDLFWIPQ
jgi:hypothetical protein